MMDPRRGGGVHFDEIGLGVVLDIFFQFKNIRKGIYFIFYLFKLFLKDFSSCIHQQAPGPTLVTEENSNYWKEILSHPGLGQKRLRFPSSTGRAGIKIYSALVRSIRSQMGT